MRKFNIILLSMFIIVSAIAISKLNRPNTTGNKNNLLPWTIQVNNGHSQVFGLTLDQSTFADAFKLLGKDIEIAIISKPDMNPAMEIFASNFRSGFLTGALILSANISDADIATLQESLKTQKEHLESGSTKITLRHEQQQLAAKYSIKSITFIPVASINESLVELRFGKPEQILSTAPYVKHYLFPNLGLDIIIDEKGKDYLHYVSPEKFSTIQAMVEKQATQTTQQ